MFSRRVFVGASKRVSQSSFSTVKADGSKSGVGKAVAFASKNRQQLINIFAVWLVVSFGVHNFNVQKAWEEQQLDTKKRHVEHDTLKESLLDKEWLESVEKKIRASKPAQNVLQAALEERISSSITAGEIAVDPKKPASSNSTDALTSIDESELNKADKKPVGVQVNSSDSGRVI
mmetsp:Transcript_1294/g.2166  ORF Transcript_1294/g.2166 Transcript_1294/m.2166 type:complete len:175 (-) Transcript_1294:44-568(-)